MSRGRLDHYRSPEQIGRMNDRDWVDLLEQLLVMRDEEAFATICDLFSFWPDGEERSRQLARSLHTMQGWDDRIRAASSSYAGLYEGERLSDVASLARSIELNRRESRGSTELYAVATSPYVSELLDLSIVASEVSGPAWAALARSSHLRSLRRLAVRRTALSQADLGLFLGSASMPALRTLELVDVGLRPETWPRAGEEHSFPELRDVDLSDNILGVEGALQLAEAAWLAGVRSLALRRNVLARAGIEALLRSPHMRRLTTLDVGDNGLSSADEAALTALAMDSGIRVVI